MSILRILKLLFLFPFRRRIPTIDIAGADTWRIVDPQKKELFVISAGVGLGIDFELGIAKRWCVEMLLLDPSPTGISTMERIGNVEGVTFKQIGLAANDGIVSFSKPLSAAEGSFFMAEPNSDKKSYVEFECKSLKTLLAEYDQSSIDILKMDIEGAECEVLDSILQDEINPVQICVEIHTHHGSGAPRGLWDASRLIFRLHLAGYRIVYNKAMDFTFVHRSALL